ncbi:MAG TPA: DUF4390 domain-containing protein [Thiothrix sp.]|nr:DUF4390 domain-containing protein [Thiothrix sp.]
MTINVTYQQMISNRIIAIITSLFLLCPILSAADDMGSIDIRSFTLRTVKNTGKEEAEGNAIRKASMFVEYRLSKAMRKALTRGIPLIAKVNFTLGQHHSWWWNTSNELLDIRFQLKYHALSKHYIVTRLDTEKHWSFSTLGGALQQMGKITEQPLPQLKNIKVDENYYLFVQATLAAKSIDLPLKLQSYLIININ